MRCRGVGVERRTASWLLWLLAVVAAGCDNGMASAPPTGYTVNVDGGGGGADVTAPVARCTFDAECSSPAAPCELSVCLPDGLCGTAPVSAGAAAAWQTLGDCLVDVCDGAGGVASRPDDADAPDDGNGCTADTCASGKPVFTNRPAGTSCAEDSAASCDGDGGCSVAF
jgi:hypothetical protein